MQREEGDNTVNFYPTTFQWCVPVGLENIHDWYFVNYGWGHQINQYIRKQARSVCRHGSSKRQKTGHKIRRIRYLVLICALWPFSTMGWPETKMQPTNVTIQQTLVTELRHPYFLGKPLWCFKGLEFTRQTSIQEYFWFWIDSLL